MSCGHPRRIGDQCCDQRGDRTGGWCARRFAPTPGWPVESPGVVPSSRRSCWPGYDHRSDRSPRRPPCRLRGERMRSSAAYEGDEAIGRPLHGICRFIDLYNWATSADRDRRQRAPGGSSPRPRPSQLVEWARVHQQGFAPTRPSGRSNGIASIASPEARPTAARWHQAVTARQRERRRPARPEGCGSDGYPPVKAPDPT
jgi:hypothetical protein